VAFGAKLYLGLKSVSVKRRFARLSEVGVMPVSVKSSFAHVSGVPNCRQNN